MLYYCLRCHLWVKNADALGNTCPACDSEGLFRKRSSANHSWRNNEFCICGKPIDPDIAITDTSLNYCSFECAREDILKRRALINESLLRHAEKEWEREQKKSAK